MIKHTIHSVLETVSFSLHFHAGKNRTEADRLMARIKAGEFSPREPEIQANYDALSLAQLEAAQWLDAQIKSDSEARALLQAMLDYYDPDGSEAAQFNHDGGSPAGKVKAFLERSK